MDSTRAEAANPANGTISPTGPNVVWQGPLTGGAGANEDTCVEGTNCDTFKLTIAGTEEDWAGKVVNINITWLTPANDYDLYIHKGENCPANGPCQGPIVSQDGNGAPSTQEVGSIDPSSTGTGVYLVRLVSFSVTPGDPYTGTASVGPEPPGRKANYIKDGLTFSPNVTVKAPVVATKRRTQQPHRQIRQSLHVEYSRRSCRSRSVVFRSASRQSDLRSVHAQSDLSWPA